MVKIVTPKKNPNRASRDEILEANAVENRSAYDSRNTELEHCNTETVTGSLLIKPGLCDTMLRGKILRQVCSVFRP